MNKAEDGAREDQVLVRGSCVVVSAPDCHGVLRRRTFDFSAENQPIAHALFAAFPQVPLPADAATTATAPSDSDLSPARPCPDPPKALVVLLKTLMHILYLGSGGGSYIVHLPFPVVNAWPIPLGLLLERQPDTPNGPSSNAESFSRDDMPLPRLFTLSGPLDEFGVVTCNGASLDPKEHILFVSSRPDSICLTANAEHNRITLWHASPDQQARRKSKQPRRRRSSIGPASYKPDQDDDEMQLLHLNADATHPLERHSSRLSDVGFTMDRTSFADPDRLTVLMTEPHDLKQELTLHIIESVHFDLENIPPHVFVLNVSPKLDILCIHARRAQVLHLFHLSRRLSTVPALKDKSRIPAISAAPISIHRSQRLLVLSPDLITRIHAPWHTRLNIVFPMTRPWRSISRVDENYFTFTDANSNAEQYCIDFAPQHRLVEWALDVLECVLDINSYSLFLSVYGNVKLKATADGVSAFTITLFAYFLAFNTRSPSPSAAHTEPKTWTMVQSDDTPLLHDPISYLPHAREFSHHFEGSQRPGSLFVILLALHALSEELRVHLGLSQHNRILVPILIQLAYWLGRPDFADYYLTSDAQFPAIDFDKHSISVVRDGPFAQTGPWSIYAWLVASVKAAAPPAHAGDPLLTLDELLRKLSPETPPGEETLVRARALLPSMAKLRRIYPVLRLPDFRGPLIGAMEALRVTAAWLDSLPSGVSYPLKIALAVCKREPLPAWSEDACALIGRKDLVALLRMRGDSGGRPASTGRQRPAEDTNTVTEICQKVLSPEPPSSGIAFADDYQRITSLIFRTDRRMLEVNKLLEHAQDGVTFWFRPSSTVPEFATSTVHQAIVHSLATRALAMPVGKGLLTFNSRIPLPTAKFYTPGFGFSFVFKMKPDNTIMTVDKSFLADAMTQWPSFHLGVAGSLTISPDLKDIDTSWIVFNKPDEPTNRYAGFLFGLGLNGYLKKVARWHLLNYLTTKHVLTSVALLLGLGVSFLGTKDPKITKLLSVHVAAMLPPGAADLKINVWIQTAGIMALGLLYFDTRHRRTSEVLLSELTISGKSVAFSYSSSIPAELPRDESYRLACGFALGLINLGKGPELRGLDERAMVDRLCRITEGLAVAENAEKNMMVAIPGCIVALALIYLRTNHTTIARKLDVPQTPELMEYVPPDLLFLRTVAKNLVMWDSIQASQAWITSQYPPHLLKTRKVLPALDSDTLDVIAIMAGACYVIGLRFAGTHDKHAKDCLLTHLDRLMSVCALRATPYDEIITIINLRSFQDAICLALAAIMAGSGDLDVLRRLRKLHGRRGDQATYGGHMAAHMAVGLLFMSGGQHTLGTFPLATAALFCATYPKFPHTPADNHFHLQALRHLWVLAAENRCLVPRSVDTFQPTLVPIRIHLKHSSTAINLTAPCLIPEISTIRAIESASMEYQHVVLDFEAKPELLAQFRRNPMIFMSPNSIATAFKTPFEQGLARVLKPYEGTSVPKKTISGAVRDALRLAYMDEGVDPSEGLFLVGSQLTLDVNAQDMRETDFDIKCGLIHKLSHAETTDELFEVKLALTSYDVRKKAGNKTLPEEAWMEDLIQRMRFQSWTGKS